MAGIESAPAARTQGEVYALQLSRLGRLPGVVLRELEYVVLLFVLVRMPDGCSSTPEEMAECVDDTPAAVRGALERLRTLRLVTWQPDPPPAGAATSTVHYAVDMAFVGARLNSPTASRPAATRAKPLRRRSR